MKRGVTISLCFLILGCATTSDDNIRIEGPTPGEKALSKIAGPTQRSEGSLWQDSSSRSFLFMDLRANHVGDIVTVKVIENAKGGKTTETKLSRGSKMKAAFKAKLGIGKDKDFGAESDFSNKMDGTGSTSRSGSFVADLPAVITAVLPNGNMVVEGVREVRINNEKEVISLKGVVRPEDISPENMVISTKIADATIEYTGKGVLNDKNRPGWASRIMDWIWPF
jgi:flagellar L-ring protein precursor FlgH